MSTRTETGWTPRTDWQDAQPFVPFLDGPPRDPQVWYEDFLTHYAEHGSKAMAIMHARTGRATLYRYLASDPVFAAETEAAWDYYTDRLQWELVHTSRTTGNPLGYFGRLKAELPAKYIEKNLSISVNATTELPPELGADVIRRMLQDAAPETLALLAPQAPVIEAQGEAVTPDA